MVAERRDDAAGGDSEPRLDHAAEHDAEAERAGGVRHPDRLADAARLRELDVDPVCDLGAGGDVAETVAVLVDIDRNRRARLQRPPAVVAGGLVWPEVRKQLARKAFLMHQPIGQGHLIAFAEDPNFRGFTELTQMLLMNAVLFGPAR